MKQPKIIGRYQIEKELARGGAGIVYLARDPRMNRLVAVKILRQHVIEEPSVLDRFHREKNTIASLEHPAIVPVYDFGEIDDNLYLVMRYMPGKSLADRLQNETLSEEEIIKIVQRVGSALEEVHTHGIVHRDLKPGNILFDGQGRAYLTDFGIAKLVDETMTATGMVLGTPSYMSPEQVEGTEEVDYRSDIYALGIILFEMLTGQRPFRGDTPIKQAAARILEPPPDIKAFNTAIDPRWDHIIQRAMKKEKTERYQSVDELLQDVNQIAINKNITPVAPLPGPKTTSKSPQVKSNRLKWAGIAVGGLLLLLLAGFIWRNKQPPLDPEPTQMPIAEAVPEIPTTPTDIAAPSPTMRIPATPTNLPLPSTNSLATTEELLTSTPSPPASNTALPESAPSPTALLTTPTAVAKTEPPLPIIITREKDRASMIQIPVTTFLMGAADTDEDALLHERPSHEVTLDTFYIDQYEVTVAQYASFLNENGGYAYRDKSGNVVGNCAAWTCLATKNEVFRSHLTKNVNTDEFVAEPGFEKYPVNSVSWFGAEEYCRWAGVRLPTEAEWELADRGTNGRLFPWGNDLPDNGRAVFDSTFNDLQPVDALPDGASPYGVFGLAGNVWEWVKDEYSDTYYQESPVNNPVNTSDIRVNPKVLRGGGYDSPATELRTTNRSFNDPTKFLAIPVVGFRCAMESN